jgi:hypothetical protein
LDVHLTDHDNHALQKLAREGRLTWVIVRAWPKNGSNEEGKAKLKEKKVKIPASAQVPPTSFKGPVSEQSRAHKHAPIRSRINKPTDHQS